MGYPFGEVLLAQKYPKRRGTVSKWFPYYPSRRGKGNKVSPANPFPTSPFGQNRERRQATERREGNEYSKHI